jgi:hypothetical protein
MRPLCLRPLFEMSSKRTPDDRHPDFPHLAPLMRATGFAVLADSFREVDARSRKKYVLRNA